MDRRELLDAPGATAAERAAITGGSALARETILIWAEGMGWQLSGSLAAQVFDRGDRPVDVKGRAEGDIPPQGLATVAARPDESFVILPCSDCEKECNRGFQHCYQQVHAGQAQHAKAMRLCLECGEICSTSAKLVAPMSPLMTSTCHACAERCDDCIAECEKLNDSYMKEVVPSLRRCAESCREMIKAMGGHQQGRPAPRSREPSEGGPARRASVRGLEKSDREGETLGSPSH